MTISAEINRVKFVAEDFQTYRDEADLYFKTNYPTAFNNLIATDLGNALMDQSAFAMQALSFMINRRSSELFLSTARLNNSITKLARMLGYPIQPAAPATTTLTLNLPSGPYVFSVPIPPHFQFQGPGSTIYEYQGQVDIVVPTGNTTANLPIKEGQTRRQTFVSDGQANQQFGILGIPQGQFIYADELEVFVDGNIWNRQSIIAYTAANNYEITFTESPPRLRFGDGIAGNIPPPQSQIVLIYRHGLGAAGAIAANQISGAVSELVINGITIPMTFTNLVSIVGSDPENIGHVKSFASSYFRTQNAAVIKEDYDSIAGLQTGVALADAQILRGIDADVTIQNNFTSIDIGTDLMLSAVSGLEAASVSGISYLGVSGISSLFVGGTAGVAVSGSSYIGKDVSGNVTGLGYLGVSGIGGLFVSGTSSLGVSGTSFLGINSQKSLINMGVSGVAVVDNAVSGLSDYLSQTMSDTSQANQVQISILSSDANNKYTAPDPTLLNVVQSTLQNIADAVVTVVAVDGSSVLVGVDITVTLGINQAAVLSDVLQNSVNALTSTTIPFGLLVMRHAGVALYVSDVEDAIRSANNAGDIRYINVKITAPSQYLDSSGNLIISSGQIIQNQVIDVAVKERFLINGNSVSV